MLVFFINSLGAVIVGLGPAAIPYVAITAALGAVCNSFMEFSRLSKQVEAFNSAQRDLHNMINDWDGMTRTERRTRSTVQQVVGTTENAMALVAIALTDSIPSTQSGGGGDDEEGEGKED